MNNTTNSRLELWRAQIGQNINNSLSPFGRWLNGIIREADYGRLVADFTIRDEMTNPAGVLHGGVAAAILDDLVGTMVFMLGREYAYTSVNLTIDYLHAARVGDVVSSTANVVRAGKNIIHCEGQIMAHDGKIVAKCTTNMIQTSVKLSL
ncbi:PaaI family thioesterase [Spirosoma areae]